MLTTEAAARLLGRSARTVLNMVERGDLPRHPFQRGTRTIFRHRRADLLALQARLAHE